MRELENFKKDVGIKFQLYNSLFTSLPFHHIEKTGILLSLFLSHCEDGYKMEKDPREIVETFFAKYTSLENIREGVDLLFRFVQYAERQVVLFDAIEDAAFNEINDISGAGSLKQLEARVKQEDEEQALIKNLESFAISLVLTAHPTQFYPGPVLGIINDLSKALKDNNTPLINAYLQQLGKTPLFKKQKPTPYDEAASLIWYLENVFYNAIGRIITRLNSDFPQLDHHNHAIIKMGFWPGGDRDGNPNVTADISIKVADALHTSIIKCYYLDVRRLKRRLTFKGIDTILADLEAKLYNSIFLASTRVQLTKPEILKPLEEIRQILSKEHNNLFRHLLDNLIYKVELFGVHFARLDIRQESSIHGQVFNEIAEKESLLPKQYPEFSETEKISALLNISGSTDAALYEGLTKDSLETIDAIAQIQQLNGEEGCNRYIISQCNSAQNVMEVFALFLARGWKKEDIRIDVVPLFETIDDLRNAPEIMTSLYSHEAYREHLKRRGMKQTIMVGFSDGTKDGGYFTANWSIYKAKETLTKVSEEFGVEVIFFDGRGGPPARGGGKTHKFYASMGKNISTKEIHLTVQGQTVSSSFGNADSASFNIEQLLNAGISNAVFSTQSKGLSQADEKLLQHLADISHESYKTLRDHSSFLSYLAEVSPLNYYSDTNISSRPAKRGKSFKLALKDLRAIPFVGAWAQIKQNVPGFYGLGSALKSLDDDGRFEKVQKIYENSLYFKTLMDNSEMAMKKTFFPLTAYLSNDARHAPLRKMIVDEYELTRNYLFKLSGKTKLMEDYPVDQLSVDMRERIVLPLTTIQQYALMYLRDPAEETKERSELKEIFEKLIVRTSFGIINAGRNSV